MARRRGVTIGKTPQLAVPHRPPAGGGIVRLLSILIVGLIVTACVTPMSLVPPGPEPWRIGYRDGCDSGTRAAGNPYVQFIKDVQRSMGDRLYREGWQDGFATCKGTYESYGR